jgi:ferritin-like metal-binding protein YciE
MASEISSMKDLFVDHLKDLYSAEKQITKALPKIIKEVTAPDLKRGLEDHLTQTQNQVDRLDRIFDNLDTSPNGKKCAGMEGLLKEGDEVMSEKYAESDLMDAALIAACQKVEHYEISAYGTARTFANLLGETEAVGLLSQTLDEEKATDEKLNQIAMGHVNSAALRSNDMGMKKDRM